MKNFLLYLWQLPQNIIALIWAGVLCIFKGKPTIVKYKDETYIWFKHWPTGVSLGSYVLIGDYYENRQQIIDHEYGHTRQSRKWGWLYLFVIAIPSVCGNIWDRLFHGSKKWAWPVSSIWYYFKLPWEREANELGGVDMTYLFDYLPEDSEWNKYKPLMA